MRIRSLLVVIVLVPLLAPAGCVTSEEARASREQAIAARDRLVASSLDLQSRLASLAPDDPSRPTLEARLAHTRASISTLSDGIAVIDAGLRSAAQPTDPVVDVLSEILPAPWRAPLLLGGVGLGLFIRSRQLRAGITTIAQGIEIAKSQDPLFKASFERHANTFRSIQSPLARKVVDTVTDRIVPPTQSTQTSTPTPESSPQTLPQETSEKPAASYSQS